MIFSTTNSFADTPLNLGTAFTTYEEYEQGIHQLNTEEFNQKKSLTTAGQLGEWHEKYLNKGFQTADEFINALELMPADEFAKKGALTSATKLSDWHYMLVDVKPEYFAKWNEKLKGLPAIGFKPDEHLWELHQPGIDEKGFDSREVGFVKHTAYKPFESEEEFMKTATSVTKENIDIFQGRTRATPAADLMKWMQPLRNENPQEYNLIVSRMRLLRKVGYGNGNSFQTPADFVRAKGTPKMKVGYGEKMEIVVRPKDISLPDFLTMFEKESPEALGAQYKALPKARRLGLLRQLKKSKPALYDQVVAKLRSRTAIGFEGNPETETIPQVEHRVKTRTKVGYTQVDQDIEQIEHPNSELNSGLKKYPSYDPKRKDFCDIDTFLKRFVAPTRP